jgi:hypothetical protein|tara:strand:+ start:220 stop:546 length:327 start_codon:yes stop_codon:yes gene_type:complete
MAVHCKECKTGELDIIGTGDYGIEVECLNHYCGAIYDLEPDGLGQGGEEWVEAKMIERQKIQDEEFLAYTADTYDDDLPDPTDGCMDGDVWDDEPEKDEDFPDRVWGD